MIIKSSRHCVRSWQAEKLHLHKSGVHALNLDSLYLSLEFNADQQRAVMCNINKHIYCIRGHIYYTYILPWDQVIGTKRLIISCQKKKKLNIIITFCFTHQVVNPRSVMVFRMNKVWYLAGADKPHQFHCLWISPWNGRTRTCSVTVPPAPQLQWRWLLR